jgi:hypothetical protein
MFNPKILSIVPTEQGALARVQRHALAGGDIIERDFSCSCDVLIEGLIKWKQGEVIQNALPFLGPSEREFFLTGLSDEEWPKEN